MVWWLTWNWVKQGNQGLQNIYSQGFMLTSIFLISSLLFYTDIKSASHVHVCLCVSHACMCVLLCTCVSVPCLTVFSFTKCIALFFLNICFIFVGIDHLYECYVLVYSHIGIFCFLCIVNDQLSPSKWCTWRSNLSVGLVILWWTS